MSSFIWGKNKICCPCPLRRQVLAPPVGHNDNFEQCALIFSDFGCRINYNCRFIFSGLVHLFVSLSVQHWGKCCLCWRCSLKVVYYFTKNLLYNLCCFFRFEKHFGGKLIFGSQRIMCLEAMGRALVARKN